MKIINPSVELWKQDNPKQHVARCARVCYGKETGNDEATTNSLITRKHYSMFRHETVYAAFKYNTREIITYITFNYRNCPYIQWIYDKGCVYVVTNGNFMLDIKHSNPMFYKIINENIISEEQAGACAYVYEHLMRYTFCVITQISTSRELNRVSPNNIAEQSTRYVYSDGNICRPYWMSIDEANNFNNNRFFACTSIGRNYINSCIQSFGTYLDLINVGGMHRQDARGILPLDTATKCIYTYSINEWRAILDLRYYGTTGKPHPNAKLIAGMIRDELIKLGYYFRD